MIDDVPEPDERTEDAATDAFAEFLALREDGAGPSLETFCAARPEIADRLRRLWARWSDVETAWPTDGSAAAAADGGGASADELLALAAGRHDDPRADRYVVGDEIGRGGMAVVHAVWDRELRRQLAMKVLAGDAVPDRPDARAVSRFLSEAQITAQLDHPGIVPVHELGRDVDGRAFFTMGLVRGESLARVLFTSRSASPDWPRSRVLEVLLKVCDAIRYAHAIGVVHRDLKPANVMVGRFGEVYVMDWGLARVLDRSASEDGVDSDREPSAPGDASADAPGGEQPVSVRGDVASDAPDSPLLTRAGDVVGTPAYMAPEQARGDVDAIGPLVDVYSIGAMLYELLTGSMPYGCRDAQATSKDVLRMVCDGPPVPVRERAADTPPELVAICEKAMARASRDRYASVDALAADLRAFLDKRVVTAYRTGPTAELRTWARRNRVAAVLACGLVLTLLVGLVLSARTTQRAQEQAERAEGNFDLALRAVDQMLTRVGAESLAGVPQMDAVRRELLEDAVAFFDELVSRDGNDASPRREVAMSQLRLARIRFVLGDYAASRSAADRADELFVALGAASLDASEPLAWSRVEARLTGIKALASSGELDAALAALVELSADVETLPRTRTESRRLAANVDYLFGYVHYQRGDADALELFERARDAELALVGEDPDALQRALLATTSIAVAQHRLGRAEDSRTSFRAAIRLGRESLAQDPTDPDRRNRLASALSNFGGTRNRNGGDAESEAALEEAVVLFRELVADYPNIASYRGWLSAALSNLARMIGVRDSDRGVELYEAAHTNARRSLEMAPDQRTIQRFLRRQLASHARLRFRRGDHDDVLARVAECGELAITTPSDLAKLARLPARSCAALRQRGDVEHAERVADGVVEILERAVERGLNDPAVLADPAFGVVRDRAAFDALVETVTTLAERGR